MLQFAGGFKHAYRVMVEDAVGVETHKGFIHPAGGGETSGEDDHLFEFLASDDEEAFAHLSKTFRAGDPRPLRGGENLAMARAGGVFT